MKILIIQTAFIGDVILATPLFHEIHRCYPSGTLDVLVRKGNESLLENFPGINSVLSWDKKNSKLKNLVGLLFRIRKEKYDLVINVQRFASTGFLTAFSGAKEKIGFKKNPFSPFFTQRIVHDIEGKKKIHETERNLLLIKSLGAVASINPVLFPSSADFESVASYKTTTYYCIAPTSVWFTKQVPTVKWLELISLLHQKEEQASIYLLGGPADRQACKEIEIQSNLSNVKTLAGTLSFLQTAALMQHAKRNYVNDSAPMHMASAMNANVTAFYCSTIPEFGFGPLSDDHKIIQVGNLNCRPCGLHGYRACPEQHFKCGFDLKME